MSTMNLYEKVQTMRCELQAAPMKKSGKNTFAKYNYFELGDFLPPINELMAKYKVTSVIRFGLELATLTLINAESPDEQIEFTSPMSTADLKNCHAVQNLGAVQTYLRRYLWTTAFEIVEHDALDAQTGNPANAQGKVTPKPENAFDKPSEDMIDELYATAQMKGYAMENVDKVIAAKCPGKNIDTLTLDEYTDILNGYVACVPRNAPKDQSA